MNTRRFQMMCRLKAAAVPGSVAGELMLEAAREIEALDATLMNIQHRVLQTQYSTTPTPANDNERV